MKCWKCGQENENGVLFCVYCGVSQKRNEPQTEEGKALRRIYDSFGCQKVFNTPNYLTNALGDILSDSQRLKSQINMAMDSGIGKLYLSQLSNKGESDEEFVNRIKTVMSEDSGLSDKVAESLINYFDEMIGWNKKINQESINISYRQFNSSNEGTNIETQNHISYSSREPQKGNDIRVVVDLKFEEAVFGTESEIELPIKETCITCGGTGLLKNHNCYKCEGRGYLNKTSKIQVKVPAGIDNGQSIRLREMGEPGKNGGQRGDLLITMNVSEHSIFKRGGYDIYSNISIPSMAAQKGNTISIPTIDGPYIYKLPNNITNSFKIKLRGKGVPTLKNKNIRGDHYVTITIKG